MEIKISNINPSDSSLYLVMIISADNNFISKINLLTE